ncbi:hypothetical protein ACFQ6N_30455 [Kitasatospora sp. NPDC056446]|uniref:hypothetical protein n=1 Tax=Kitasatospora sp. NPDC056446 TaxID=3345819 RepID=UPI00369628B4
MGDVMALPAPDLAADASCVAVYRDLRDGVARSCAQIGYGYNLYPISTATARHLQQVLASCLRDGRMHEYGTVHDEHDRALAAALAGEYLGVPVDEDQVMFCAGASEGIGLVSRYLTACGASMILPAPCYFAFEQTPRRHPLAVAGRYRGDGAVHWSGGGAGHTAVVEILPNGVTGTGFRPPAVQADFRVLDLVFQAGGHSSGRHMVADHARTALAGRLTDTAVLMTPSKDLSLPGLRAGLLISGDTALIAAARDDVFDRVASANPMAGQFVLLYLTVLLMAEAAHDSDPGTFARRHAWVRAQYKRHRVSTCPTESTCRAITGHLDRMAGHFAEAFGLLTHHGAGLLQVAAHMRPIAGYSLLPRLNVDLPTPQDLVGWVNTVGRRFDLKLNPSLLFGGTLSSWNALYPGEPRIRVNLSVPHADLVRTLDMLRTARRELDRVGAKR